MRSLLGALLAVLLLATVACKKNTNDEDLLKKVVIEGYLFEGEQVDDIRLTELIPFGGEDSVADPINNAEVRILWRGLTYALEPRGGDSGYYHYPHQDLPIAIGEQYRLEVDYFDKTATAETTVPPAMSGLSLSMDTMEVDLFQFLLDSLLGGEGKERDPLVATWDSEPGVYYYVVIRNIEANPQSIYPDFILELQDFFVFSRPFQDNRYEVFDLELTHLGRHEVRIFRVNQEYVDLFTSLDQDSRTLNEPITNVDNGLGVFSAFTSVVDTFFVKSAQ